MSDYQYLENVVAIKNVSHQIEKVDQKLKKSIEKNQSKREEQLQEQKLELLNQIEKLKEKYTENHSKVNRDNQAVTAFVLFRSMEGCERAKYAF